MNRLPAGNELFLDHVGYFLADLEGAAARFERLGFTVSPVNIHYNDADGELVRSGTANRLIVFEAGYIEALGRVADTPLGAELAAGVARYEGLHLLALAHERVEEHDTGGTDMRPTVFLRRPLEDGRIVRATVRRATAGAMPEGRVQLLTHETPDLIWLPGMDRHANAARALTGFLQIVADPEEAAERYARFANRPARRSGPAFEIALDRGRFALAGPDALGALLAGCSAPIATLRRRRRHRKRRPRPRAFPSCERGHYHPWATGSPAGPAGGRVGRLDRLPPPRRAAPLGLITGHPFQPHEI